MNGAGLGFRAGLAGLLAACAMVPGMVGAQAQTNTVVYNCHDNTAVNATYDNAAGTLSLDIGGSVTVRLNQAVSGSGIRYTGGGYEAYGKSNWLNVVRPGLPELKCSEIGRIGPPPPSPQPMGLPRPFQQQSANPSFDCSGRLNPTEARICANPELAELDRRMASAYSWLLGQLPPGRQGQLKQDQRAWLGRRNACGANDQCIEGGLLERTGYLNEYLEPASAPPRPGGVPAGAFAAKSWGGIVRAGPGQQFNRVASLNEGEPITVLERSGAVFQGRPWFRISFRGQVGYHWGGIICPIGRPVPGTWQVCN
jgi:uncharacterized protein YecT (DUF1311 family)/membrane-bound inhibitor of C-type lysozyme